MNIASTGPEQSCFVRHEPENTYDKDLWVDVRNPVDQSNQTDHE
jgi:hypothetical protein